MVKVSKLELKMFKQAEKILIHIDSLIGKIGLKMLIFASILGLTLAIGFWIYLGRW